MAKFNLQTITKDGGIELEDVTGGIFGVLDSYDAVPNSFLIFKLDAGAAGAQAVTIKTVTDPVKTVQGGGVDIGDINRFIQPDEVVAIYVPPAYRGLNGLVKIEYPDGTTDLTGGAFVVDAIGGCSPEAVVPV